MKLTQAFALLGLVAVIGCRNDEWVEPFEERLEVSLVDSIGVDIGDSCYVFGYIMDAEFGPDGNIYVLDQAAQCIRVYTQQGEFLRNLSRDGYGPGEFVLPTELAILADGIIGVADPWKQAVVFLDNEGNPIIDDTAWSLMPPVCLCTTGENGYAGCLFEASLSGAEVLIVILPSSFCIGNSEVNIEFHRDTLLVNPEQLGSSALTGISGEVIMTSNGADLVFYSLKSPKDYTVRVWSTDGSEVFTVSTPIPPVEKTETDIEEELQLLEVKLAAYGISILPDNIQVDPFFPQIVGLGVDADNNLWVQRGTENVPVFDVFDHQGTHCATAVLSNADRNWAIRISPSGALAWNSAAEEAQKLYILELPEI